MQRAEEPPEKGQFRGQRRKGLRIQDSLQGRGPRAVSLGCDDGEG